MLDFSIKYPFTNILIPTTPTGPRLILTLNKQTLLLITPMSKTNDNIKLQKCVNNIERTIWGMECGGWKLLLIKSLCYYITIVHFFQLCKGRGRWSIQIWTFLFTGPYIICVPFMTVNDLWVCSFFGLNYSKS